MMVYRVATTQKKQQGAESATYHTVLGFAPNGINTTLQQGDFVCVVGRVQLRKSTYNGAWEYSCIAESVAQVPEPQAKILQEEIAELRLKLSAMLKRYKDETLRVEDAMSANAAKRPASGDIAW